MPSTHRRCCAGFFDETGAVRVEARLAGALVFEMNYRELLTTFIDRGVAPIEAKTMIGDLNIENATADGEETDIDDALETFTPNSRLSPSDRSCPALPQIRRTTAVTYDRNWTYLDDDVEIEMVR